MRPTRKTLLFIIPLILCVSSCYKDSTLRYCNVTMGDMTDGVFISDQGNRFEIKEQTCAGTLDTIKRAMITCDILSKTGEDTYDIRLNGFSSVFTKSPVDSTAVTDSSIFVEDPVSIGEMWYSGGYLNMFICLPIKPDSKTAHMINLVLDDEASKDGLYLFTLKHNAYGEVITEDDKDFVLGGTYTSFPVSNIIKEDKAEIRVSWTSGVTGDDALSQETERNSLTIDWERSGYEHKNTAVRRVISFMK